MKNTKDMKAFKNACKDYLKTISLDDLRRYGRSLKLQKPTTLKKADLINEIILVLCAEKTPSRNRRGAPIKNLAILPEIPSKIEELCQEIFGFSVLPKQENVVFFEPTQEQTTFVELESTSTAETPEPSLDNSSVINLSLPIKNLNAKQKRLLLELLESLTQVRKYPTLPH